MIRMYSSTRPPLVEGGRWVNAVTRITLVNLDIQEEEQDGNKMYSYVQAAVLPANMNRAGLISAIIRAKYSQDAMEAIVNNYIGDGKNKEALTEFQQMQQWRNYAKTIADNVLTAEVE